MALVAKTSKSGTCQISLTPIAVKVGQVSRRWVAQKEKKNCLINNKKARIIT